MLYVFPSPIGVLYILIFTKNGVKSTKGVVSVPYRGSLYSNWRKKMKKSDLYNFVSVPYRGSLYSNLIKEAFRLSGLEVIFRPLSGFFIF